jgi:hypothetical protein
VWPLGAAIALRIRDPLSLIPWWLFASVAGLIAIVAVPDLVSASRIRRAVRTDAGVREAIGGVLTFGREEATLSAGRGDGLVARWSAASAWIRAVRIAYGAARRAGLPAYLVEAASFDAVRGSRHLDDGLPAADGVRSR